MLSFSSLIRRISSRRLSRFTRDDRGVSAVEFALVLPLMIVLFFGCVEACQTITIDRKVTLTARTVADLVAQVATIDNAGVDSVLGASTTILAPYSRANATVTVSVVKIDKDGRATIDWSRSTNGAAAHSSGASVNVPEALRTPNTSLVWGETAYNYTPTLTQTVTGPMTLSDQIFMRPRLSETVRKT